MFPTFCTFLNEVLNPEGDNEVYLGTLPWIQAGGEDRS